jgi:hypothetical protein
VKSIVRTLRAPCDMSLSSTTREIVKNILRIFIYILRTGEIIRILREKKTSSA